MVTSTAMKEGIAAAPAARAWRSTLASGIVTMLLAAAALLLPVAEWMPRSSITGLLLLLAGLAELFFGVRRPANIISKVSIGSGIVTALAGLVLLANPLTGFFPVANIVIAWLLVRGAAIVGAALARRSGKSVPWMALTGVTDVALGLMLIMGMPIAIFIASLFGPTFEIVASFAVILAVSFAVTGIAQIRIALLERSPT